MPAGKAAARCTPRFSKRCSTSPAGTASREAKASGSCVRWSTIRLGKASAVRACQNTPAPTAATRPAAIARPVPQRRRCAPLLWRSVVACANRMRSARPAGAGTARARRSCNSIPSARACPSAQPLHSSRWAFISALSRRGSAPSWRRNSRQSIRFRLARAGQQVLELLPGTEQQGHDGLAAELKFARNLLAGKAAQYLQQQWFAVLRFEFLHGRPHDRVLADLLGCGRFPVVEILLGDVGGGELLALVQAGMFATQD